MYTLLLRASAFLFVKVIVKQYLAVIIADAGHMHINYLPTDKNVGNSHNVLQSKTNHSFHAIEIILKTKLD